MPTTIQAARQIAEQRTVQAFNANHSPHATYALLRATEPTNRLTDATLAEIVGTEFLARCTTDAINTHLINGG